MPQSPAPTSNRSRAAFIRAALILFGLGFGAFFALSAYQSGTLGQLPQNDQTYLIGSGAVGAVLGAIAGLLVWWLMPVLLPPAAAFAAGFFANSYGLHWPTVAALAVMAATLSVIFMRLIQRITF